MLRTTKAPSLSPYMHTRTCLLVPIPSSSLAHTLQILILCVCVHPIHPVILTAATIYVQTTIQHTHTGHPRHLHHHHDDRMAPPAAAAKAASSVSSITGVHTVQYLSFSYLLGLVLILGLVLGPIFYACLR